jgi:nucleoside-diphosphate-sugar epimerase
MLFQLFESFVNGKGKGMAYSLAADLDHVLTHTYELWEELRGKQIFLTGGTGFFGCWLLESFAWANEKLNLNASVLVLTRNLNAFRQKAPHLVTQPAIKFHLGDVRSFEFPKGNFSHVIHAATEVNTKLNEENPLLMLDVITQGTKHTLEFAKHCRAQKFLLASSGAVYGKQPSHITHIAESYLGAPDVMNPVSVYGEGKRLAELLCNLYANQYGIDTKIARCFTFIGPYLPLNGSFAIGNFIRDGIKGEMIHIAGDGTPYRSYLYATDMVIWLWHILFRGRSSYPYNVGSEGALSVADLANQVAAFFQPKVQVRIAKSAILGKLPDRYVPSTQRASTELELQQTIDLLDSIKRSIAWYAQAEANYHAYL